jgi:biopolymer transport protein ExbD
MDEQEFDTINVIPFIDILLVLLTIVLTTSTFITSGALAVNLPKGKAPKVEQVESVSFTIDDNGQLFFEKRPITIEQIATTMASYDRTSAVLIHADRQIALQTFINVMTRIKAQGFNKVSLLTESSS